MKSRNFLITVVLLLMVQMTFALEPQNCREVLNLKNTHLKSQWIVEKDLVEGLWWGELRGVIYSFYFDPSGLVISIADDYPYGPAEEKMWSTYEIGGKVFLSFISTQGTDLFVVMQNCAGIILTDVNNHAHYKLVYQGAKKENHNYHDLIGTWTAVSYPFAQFKGKPEIEGARLSYAFNENGTFVRNIHSSMHHYAEGGVWHLTEDAQYIVLYYFNDSPVQTYQSEVIRILNKDFGHLDLEYVIKSRDNSELFGTNGKVNTFEKKISHL